MRIRKRPAQQAFPWISPLSSDPSFNRSPVVQHPQRRQSPPASDHPSHPIRRQQQIQDRDSSSTAPETTTRATHGKEPKKKEDDSVLKQGGEEERGENGEEEESNYTTRKKSVSREELGTGSLSHQAEESWCEGEQTFPSKKRRRMQKDNDDKSSKKIRGGNGALVEGSRCSRVNGRGWRCCQQTLVGYSLCEHHLGKGRVRSITGVKSRSNDDNAGKKGDLQPSLSKQVSDGKPSMKLGTVKARSISSLLALNDNVIAVSEDD